MRLWSIHPKYLDAKGLTALWREGLLAQQVLLGKTKGYQNHPQLLRFKNHRNPTKVLACYLHAVCDEAERRGYAFSRNKIVFSKKPVRMCLKVTSGQLAYEFKHLKKKLKQRAPAQSALAPKTKVIQTHPIFSCISGDVEDWEKRS